MGLGAAPRAHFWPDNLNFSTLRLYNPHFFQLRRTQLNGIISSPYPEVTLDTFGLRVGGRFAVWQAVLWPRLLKVAFFGPQIAVFFAQNQFLWPASKKLLQS